MNPFPALKKAADDQVRVWQDQVGLQKIEAESLDRPGLWKHPKMCSCSMCCNARNSPFNKGKNKLTRRERIQELRESDE